jgi:hypothetical protein
VNREELTLSTVAGGIGIDKQVIGMEIHFKMQHTGTDIFQ